MDERITKIEDEMTEFRTELAQAVAMREHCPLEPYKNEMRQRCENFNDKIIANKDAVVAAQAEFDFKMNVLEARVGEKIKQNRTIIGRLISSGVILGVCLVGIIGSLQLYKVSVTEYNNHLNDYRIDRAEEKQNFKEFLDTYTFDRDKRDGKIDNLFDEQRSFNMQIMKQNALLTQQLEVIKVKIKIDENKQK